ncbi:MULTISPECIES: PaaI family thioesterase [Glutamicibacter]|uniref:PaaI family thioesterase n=1 Tax=Glutamicibacter halophytocola TaxID=1933880 RepID=A0AA94XXC6_9MICC|nr:PaaI family thioesterase [Glutamicibacter halophytocola]MBF6673129.1 PaaI family thioesterase [Glutamicibacter sp. FBE19]UUX59033.1 PaaI family thioesterase [Glutamicibacter halophytocola]
MSSPAQRIPDKTSRFTDSIGLVFDDITATSVRGHADLNEEHHTPWGVVHGGVYASMIESAGSVGASYAVSERNQFAVGVHNATDFLRPTTGARVQVAAKALFQGKTQQLWEVVITDEASGKELSRGQLRTQNVDMPSA